jgi:glycosyltransferase involved in cell wall biosynthesis
MRFLVTRTISFLDDDPWGEGVDVENEAGYVNSRVERFPPKLRGLAQRWYEFQFGLRVLRLSRRYDAVAVGRYGIWLPILQRLLGSRKRVLLTDTEWREVRGGRINHLAALASAAVCSNTRVEIERYSRQYDIPRERFVLVPLAFQKRDICSETCDQGYVFAGGAQGRDWGTLVRAVDGLPYDVRVFTKDKLPRLPANTTVSYVSRQEYFQRMAAASCVVVPLLPEPLRVTGTTTWTAAMAMGKVVIVTEPFGAPDYMDQGVSGFYVNHGDAEGLRRCIDLVMRDPELRQRVGEAARARAWREFSPEVFRQRILCLLAGEHFPRLNQTAA